MGTELYSCLVFPSRMTSDHGMRPEGAELWERLDAETYNSEKHVPLIVKYPGQRCRADGDAPLTAAQLHPLFSDFLNDPEKVAQWAASQDAGDGTAVLYERE